MSFAGGPPRGQGLVTSREIILFQEKLKGERKAELNSLTNTMRPATTMGQSRSTGSLDSRHTSTELEPFPEFPESPGVLASTAFMTLRSAGRLVPVESSSTFQFTRPNTTPARTRVGGPTASYTAQLSMGLGSCPPMKRKGGGVLKSIERTMGASMPVRRWE
eukprot:gb/GFBE01056447.1/.p1 GENE.gb/GFBE01056447.1/~~gb/GFBE01056447.1/.p1  ORF type:complete len:162 (+),score=6.79 gb/GFBE01056447.1/:1-486(+)